MPHAHPVNWQSITEMPLIASMIDGALDDTREHLDTLNQVRDRPHVLDDATLDRSKRVYIEQLEFVEIYAQQIDRWRTGQPSANQARELNRMDEQNRQLRAATEQVLTLGSELRKGTIDRIRGMSDLELGLQAFLGGQKTTR